MDKICPICNKIFEGKRKSHKYCSIACQKKIYHKNNKKKNNERSNKYYLEHLKEINIYRQINKKYYEEKSKEWHINNKVERKIYDKIKFENLKNNKEKYKEFKAKINKYVKKKCKNDKLYKIKRQIRATIYDSFKRKNMKKPIYTEQILGCTIGEFKTYISSKFKEGMTWENYGYYSWHLDHIIPLKRAKTKEEVIKLCHHTNFQPLWAEENFEKSSKEKTNAETSM